MTKVISKEVDAEKFFRVLRKTVVYDNTLRFGNFSFRGSKGVSSQINSSNRTHDFLGDRHEYTFPFGVDGEIEISLQLYKNTRDHYRLFAYTRVGHKRGMTFSINLTTKKDAQSIIFLEQTVSFKEQYPDASDGGIERRRQKQLLLCDILRRLGMDVDDNCRLVLGVFDPNKGRLLDTDPNEFLNNFLVAALLKGHFQGNKGYELDVLPSLQEGYDIFGPAQSNPKWHALREPKPQARTSVPLAIRYKVLARDDSTCNRCGRGPGDGLVLHVDHKKPVSRGGDNSLENLWTLCVECNLGKGNRIIDKNIRGIRTLKSTQ